MVDFFTRYTKETFFEILDKFVTDDTLWIGFTTTFNTKIVDRVSKEYDVSTLESLIGRNDVLEIIDYAKSINPKVRIVAGGAKVKNLFPFDCIEHLIVGQGETAALALTRALIENDPFPRSASDVEYPYNSFNRSMIEYQKQDIIFDGEHLPIEIARGCIFKCSFCTYPLNGKKMWDFVKRPNVLHREMIRNYQLFKTTGYLVSDDTLNDSVEKIQMLHSSITSLPFEITLGSYTRLDLIVAHPETLDLMYEMGCRSLFFGIETLNKRTGQAIGKGMHPDRIKKGLEYVKTKYPDILITGSFIFGLPYETKESLQDTIDYLKTSPIDHFTINPFSIHPKSMIGLNPQKYGYEISDVRNWNNGYMTYDDALGFTAQALTELQPRNKLSFWFMHRVMNCGYTFEDCHTKIMTRDIKNDIRARAKRLRDQYLINLLNL